MTKLAESGIRLAQYAGAESIAVFTSVDAELQALTSKAAITELSWRAKLVITGEDRTRWLNGMVTNNVRDLPLNHGNYSFLLNAQGKIQADLTIHNRGEFFLVSCDRNQAERIRTFFDQYIIMDDVEVTEITEKLSFIAVTGPESRELLGRAGLDFPELQRGEVFDLHWHDIGCTVARGVDDRFESYELWFYPDNGPVFWDALVQAGGVAAGTEALEAFRILMGVPRVGIDIRDRELPQETGQERALHHAKGCYIGQEIVERIRSRGAVHRQFVGFEFDSALPPVGEKVLAGEKEVGEITSTAELTIAGCRRFLALGYLRREAATPGGEVQSASISARVLALPFKF